MALAPSVSARLLLPSPSKRLRFLSLRSPESIYARSSFGFGSRYSSASRRLIEPAGSVRMDRLLTGAEEMGEGFFEAIEELERMARDPSDVLGGMTGRLSLRELQLVLVYFAQEGRDSYCALEVFDWIRRENRVDGETMELMVSISCAWIERMIGRDHSVCEVVGMINEVECVGVKPGFSMVEKVVSLYWDKGKKDGAMEFVKEVMRRSGIGGHTIDDGSEIERGGPVGYLAWKMMVDGNYIGAIKMVFQFKECGLEPEAYSYLIALTAVVKEQKEFSTTLRKLNGLAKSGLVGKLDSGNLDRIECYQSDLIKYAVRLSNWAVEAGGPRVSASVHERLLALYTCAGHGLEAERHLRQLKLSGRDPDPELRDAILAICASQNEAGAVRRLLTGVDTTSPARRRKTLSWLLRGYLKGRYYVQASETLAEMLELGLPTEYLDRVAVLQGLRKIIQDSAEIQPYIMLCKRLSDMELIGPCLIYMYVREYKLWVLKML